MYAVLSSLPWVGRELYEKKEMEFDRLLQTIENYIKYDNSDNFLANNKQESVESCSLYKESVSVMQIIIDVQQKYENISIFSL